MAREINVNSKYLKRYSTMNRARNAAHKLGDDLMFLVVPTDDGKFTPVFTNAIRCGRSDIPHLGYMIVG